MINVIEEIQEWGGRGRRHTERQHAWINVCRSFLTLDRSVRCHSIDFLHRIHTHAFSTPTERRVRDVINRNRRRPSWLLSKFSFRAREISTRLRQQGHSISFIRLRSTSTMRSIFVPAAAAIVVNLLVLAVVFVQSEHAVDSYRWTRSLPSLPDQDALQWLSTRSVGHRWYKQPSPDQPSEEIARAFKRLQLVNENGIEQFDSHPFDGFPMEVLYEIARQRSKKG